MPIQDRTNRYNRRRTALVVDMVLCGFVACQPGARAVVSRPGQVATLRALEGTVAKVDVAAGTIRVARGPFGLFAKTLEVKPATQIRVVGRPATLSDIRETATVRIGYTDTRGRSMATTIDMVLAPTITATARTGL